MTHLMLVSCGHHDTPEAHFLIFGFRFFDGFNYYLSRLPNDVACIQTDDRANVNLFKGVPINSSCEGYNVSLGRS